VGRYQFVREIVKGPFGTLYELRAEADAGGLDALGHLVSLPGDLAPEVEQAIAETAWESMELRHERVLCVADVVFGKGWVLLIHDYAEGTLLRSLQRRAQERDSGFPVSVALRVVIDMLDGLDQDCSVCESAGINWKPGGASATSLYLCGDGRTRSFDDQLMATLVHAEQLREHATFVECVAPELLDSKKQPDERADVFAAGTVLWELLTGRELTQVSDLRRGRNPGAKLPSVSTSAPKGTQIPQSVVQAINAALQLDPAHRMATRSALRSALLKGVELATYEKVIDFVDALLHRESTLFRLTFDMVPKLSDQLRSERPKPPRLERNLQLSRRPPSVTSRPTRTNPQETHAKPSTSTARSAEAPATRKVLANRTLIGISPVSSLRPQSHAAAAIDARPTELELESEVAELIELEPEPESAKVAAPIPVPVLDATAMMELIEPHLPEIRLKEVPALVPEIRPDSPAVSEETIDVARLPKSARRHVLQVSLVTLVIGWVVTVAASVLATIMIQRGSSKYPTTHPTTTAMTGRIQVGASPILERTPAPPVPTASINATAPSTSSVAAPSGESPSVKEKATSTPPVTTPSGESPSAKDPTPNSNSRLASPPNRTPVTDSPVVPRNVERKRKQQYVPHGL
jgi:hypothetical protein